MSFTSKKMEILNGSIVVLTIANPFYIVLVYVFAIK